MRIRMIWDDEGSLARAKTIEVNALPRAGDMLTVGGKALKVMHILSTPGNAEYAGIVVVYEPDT
jgi:hypothetical protein